MPGKRASENRAIRQEALREQLAEQCRVQHILENIKKLEKSDPPIEGAEVLRIKTATDIRLKLLGKYLPDLKATEVTGADGGALVPDVIKIVNE